jgi:hypothetical protein
MLQLQKNDRHGSGIARVRCHSSRIKLAEGKDAPPLDDDMVARCQTLDDESQDFHSLEERRQRSRTWRRNLRG